MNQEKSTLEYVLFGFIAATALAWNKVIHSIIVDLINDSNDIVTYEALYAIILTLFAVLIYKLIKKEQK